jgi:transposase
MFNLAELGAKLTVGRQPGQELSPAARAAIAGAVAAGASQTAVANAFSISRRAVQLSLQRFESSTTFESKPRTGRPEILTRREKRYIIQLAKRKPCLTTQLLTNIVDARISRSTVRRVLRHHRMRKWRAQKRIPLTKAVAMARYKFACLWLENLEVLMRVSDSEVYP